MDKIDSIALKFENSRNNFDLWYPNHPIRMSEDKALTILSSYSNIISRALVIGVIESDKRRLEQIAALASRPYILEAVIYEQLFNASYVEAFFSLLIYSLIGEPRYLNEIFVEFDISTKESEINRLLKKYF